MLVLPAKEGNGFTVVLRCYLNTYKALKANNTPIHKKNDNTVLGAIRVLKLPLGRFYKDASFEMI